MKPTAKLDISVKIVWRRRQPCLEALEGRLLFSTYTVTTLGDAAGTVTPAGAGKFKATTLRAAMTAANAHAGADTIKFAAAVTGTINLGKALPQIADTLTLTGPGAAKLTVQRSAAATTDFSIFYVDAGKASTISGLTIAGGTGTVVEFEFSSLYGGAIYLNSGTLTVTNSTLSGNSADAGGGIYLNSGALTVTNSTLSGNSAGFGSGIWNSGGTLTVTNSTLSSNSSVQGGGINNNSGTLTVKNSTFSGNLADYGGGILNFGTLTVTNSTLSGNSAGGGGGGISNSGTLTVTNSTLPGNSAGGGGGGIHNSGTLTVTNSTLSGNSAYGGGGVYNQSDATLTVTNSTLSGNSAGGYGGGGINNDSGTATVANSIVVGNVLEGATTPSNITGTLASTSSYNITGTGGSGGLVNGVKGNKVGVAVGAVKLGSLADNGGPTKTVAVLPGSIAINAGSNARAVGPDGKSLATDQRGTGFARIIGGRVDIGAFERQSATDATGSISGIVFKDVNGNHVRDSGEPGLKDWLVYADLNHDGRLNHDEPRAVTNATGQYVLVGVPAGKQLIRLFPQPRWRQTHPRGGGAHGPTVIVGTEIGPWDFGVQPILG